MKHLLGTFLSFASIFLFSCNNSADKETTESDSPVVVTHSAWQATLDDSSGKLDMKQTTGTGPDSLTAGSIISYLNTLYPRVKLHFLRISNDTAYAQIPDATYLTQQMGSTGPTMYFATVVYNLTEIPGITHVHVDFAEGDHASPGVFSRQSFKEE